MHASMGNRRPTLVAIPSKEASYTRLRPSLTRKKTHLPAAQRGTPYHARLCGET